MDDEKLIYLVRQHEELFNVSHKKYSDNSQKDKTWRAIGAELHQSGGACKMRWFNLRDQYRRAMKSKRVKGAHAAENKKKWKYEDEMSFLLPFLQERDAVPFLLPLDEFNNCNDGEMGESQTMYAMEESVDDVKEKDDQEPPSKTQERERGTPDIHRRRGRRKLLPRRSLSAVLMKYVMEKSKIASKTDQIDNFFQSVAASVRTLTPIRQNLVKSKIFTIVSEIELDQLKEEVRERE
ncbi:uncharacterized protein LOC124156009 [Ischnura elegans]|uniref:uncharacterized protein LOC124156009 n=1 Tax=Ischnura elegans TaxID=197161 RepID=UPI001ED8796A|nr:uncharacterized protein LOC124156009 [Ischnura elegans]